MQKNKACTNGKPSSEAQVKYYAYNLSLYLFFCVLKHTIVYPMVQKFSPSLTTSFDFSL